VTRKPAILALKTLNGLLISGAFKSLRGLTAMQCLFILRAASSGFGRGVVSLPVR
jgi:hypothetical protein